jgi:hypothetical protein
MSANDSSAPNGNGSVELTAHRGGAGGEPGRVGLVVILAVASVLICSLALGTRTLTSVDLGYHLAYGEHALTTGELVDHNPYLYTLPPLDLSPSARPEPGPGSWYDAEGRYRFPNANWLSQVAMAAVYQWRGVTGLSVLTCGLVLILAQLLIRSSRRLELSWVVAAGGLLWFWLVGHSRLNLRPELFGYLALAGELVLLGPMVLAPKRAANMSGRLVAAVVVLHLLFVNLHSYSLLGLLISGAIFAECLIRSIVMSGEGQDARDAWRQARLRSGLLLASMAVVSFANPWTWRIAILPVETLLYLHQHQIAGVSGAHPWSNILEFHQTLSPDFPNRVSDFAIAGFLVLAGVGAVSALARRQWALLIVLAGMSAVSLSMKRNVAAAALVVIPLGLAALRGPLLDFGRHRAPVRGAIITVAVALLVIASAATFTYSLVTNRFYVSEGHPMRFGLGISRTNLPIGAAQWIDAHLPDARVWCDMVSSSTLHFFTKPHREMPVLTNTWAYPPAALAENHEVRALARPITSLVEDYGADVVVINYKYSPPLLLGLARHPIWELVHVEGPYATFARLEGSQSEVVRAESLAALPDVDAYVRHQRKLDPVLRAALLHPGIVYLRAGLGELAIATFTAIVRERPDRTVAWNYLGLGYVARAMSEPENRLADFEAARKAFDSALELDPGNEIARGNIRTLTASEERLEHPRSRALEDEQRGRDPL